jgi:hypothetical protein
VSAAPLLERVVVYASAQPRLVLWAARVLAVQSAAAAAGAAAVSYRQLTAAFASKQDVWNYLMGLQELTGPELRLGLPVGFAAMAAVAGAAAQLIARRTVIGIEVTRPQGSGAAAASASQAAAAAGGLPADTLAHESLAAEETVFITRPRIWASLWTQSARSELGAEAGGSSGALLPSPAGSPGTVTETAPRAMLKCAAPNTTFTSFRLNLATGRVITMYLFPVRGWRSDEAAYLRTLIYGDYFRREERPPPPDTTLIAIEGFGAYRPAQFADTHNPLFPEAVPVHPSGDASVPVPLPGTPFYAAQGTVWAQFQLPPRKSLEERRAAVRRAALAAPVGARLDPVLAVPGPDDLPRVGAPTNIALDGRVVQPRPQHPQVDVGAQPVDPTAPALGGAGTQS